MTQSSRFHVGQVTPGNTGLALALLAFAVYSSLFIYRTSFVIHGERYFSLFDDGMISMRYARHLAAGYGLAWNRGDAPIEGFTNPLWVLYMAAIHLLPAPLSKMSLFVQATCACLLAANLFVVRRVALAISNNSEMVSLGAVVLTGWYLPLNNWSLQGMEVAPLVLVVSQAMWLCLRCMATDSGVGPLYILLGVSTWVRPDMVVTTVAFAAFMIACDAKNRRRHVRWASAVLVVAVASQTAFRLWYFHEPLPNTYYLKMTGYPVLLRAARGAAVLAQFVWQSNPLLWLVACFAAFRRDRSRWLLLWIVIAQMGYSVYVGGDAWEYWGGSNRYISIAMPAFFILVSSGLADITAALASSLTGEWSSFANAWTATGVFAVVVVLALFSVNTIHGAGALGELLLLKPALHSGPGDENQQDVEAGLFLDHATAPDGSVALTRAGTLPYFSDRPTIDLLGKTDPHIALESSRVPGGPGNFMAFRPGHTKFDASYSIGELQPDLVLQPWDGDSAAMAYLRKDYRHVSMNGRCVWARIGSSKIMWPEFQPCSAMP